MVLRRWLFRAGAAALLVAALAAPPVTAAASTPAGPPSVSGTGVATTPNIPPPHWYEYRAVNGRYEGYHTGDWVICAHFVNRSSKTAHASCSRTVTASTSFSLSGGYSPGEVSGSVGFNISVSYQYSTQYGLTVDLPPHTQAYIAFGIDYNQYGYGMEKRYCIPTYCLPWSSPSPVTVQQALNPAIGAFDRRPV